MTDGSMEANVRELLAALEPTMQRLTGIETAPLPDGMAPITDKDALSVSVGELRRIKAAVTLLHQGRL